MARHEKLLWTNLTRRCLAASCFLFFRSLNSCCPGEIYCQNVACFGPRCYALDAMKRSVYCPSEIRQSRLFLVQLDSFPSRQITPGSALLELRCTRNNRRLSLSTKDERK